MNNGSAATRFRFFMSAAQQGAFAWRQPPRLRPDFPGFAGKKHKIACMKLIFLGPPGAGKGTQSGIVEQRLGLASISTGDMFREELGNDTELGRKAKGYMDAGELVPDEVVIDMVKVRIAKPDCAKGFILDGFPRTIPQAEALAQEIELDLVLDLRCDLDVVARRLGGRRVHKPSGRIYHLDTKPPKVPDQDDETGEPLSIRDDDQPETIANRLQVYQEQTAALVEHYTQRGSPPIAAIDGMRPIDQVAADIIAAIEERGRG